MYIFTPVKLTMVYVRILLNFYHWFIRRNKNIGQVENNLIGMLFGARLRLTTVCLSKRIATWGLQLLSLKYPGFKAISHSTRDVTMGCN